MRVAIHQPYHLPWLGDLANSAAADLVIVLDSVQYEKNGCPLCGTRAIGTMPTRGELYERYEVGSLASFRSGRQAALW